MLSLSLASLPLAARTSLKSDFLFSSLCSELVEASDESNAQRKALARPVAVARYEWQACVELDAQRALNVEQPEACGHGWLEERREGGGAEGGAWEGVC